MNVAVLLHDPRRLLLEGKARLLRERGVQVVWGTRELLDLLTADVDDVRIDAAVLCVDGDRRQVLRVVRELRRRHRAIRIIGTTRSASDVDPVLARELFTVVDANARVGAIVEALRGQRAPLRLSSVPTTARQHTMTCREREVLVLLASGCSASEVAVQLSVSRKTIENHKQRLFAKLGVQNQAHAVAVALRAGDLPSVAGSLKAS